MINSDNGNTRRLHLSPRRISRISRGKERKKERTSQGEEIIELSLGR